MWLRKWAIVALLVLILLCIGIPAGAWKASKLGAAVGDIYFGWEWVIQRPSATLFHSQNLAATDTEALAISFPSAGNSFAPAIAQTTAETATATDTGFFTANWCYTALTNHGGYDLVPDVSMWHPVKIDFAGRRWRKLAIYEQRAPVRREYDGIQPLDQHGTRYEWSQPFSRSGRNERCHCPDDENVHSERGVQCQQ